MAFHCPSCNGSMVFDVATQAMLCKHCGTTRDPHDYVVRDQGIVTCANCGANLRTPRDTIAKFCPKCGTKTQKAVLESDAAEPSVEELAAMAEGRAMARFSCQNCGAELEGTDDSLIGFCPYCGGQSMVRAGEATYEVEGIVPFKVDKQSCVQLYEKFTKGVGCLPKEFKDPSFIQNFVGIYMPYFQYDVQLDSASVKGTKTVERNSRYDVINHYAIDATVGAVYKRGVSFDASKYLDDEISNRVQPFDLDLMEPFTPAYLAGFYADASTVDPKLYNEDAQEIASDDLVEVVSNHMSRTKGISVNKTDAEVRAQTLRHHTALLPLWFLTWRKEDRVAYAVINGETGEVVSDLPLDLKAFALRCALVSVALFAILESLFQPTPFITSAISLLAAMAMAYCLLTSARTEYESVSHANDKGWEGTMDEGEDSDAADGGSGSNGKRAKKKKKKKKGKNGCLRTGLEVAAMIVIALAVMMLFTGRGAAAMTIVMFLLPLVAIPLAGYVTFKVAKWNRSVNNSSSIVSAIVLLITTIINIAIMFISPVNDGWYYLGDALCIVGLVIAAVAMMITYNRATTRPAPKLFNRTEVE
ncbi:MAG: zinc ribbon domain-containing protein [Atopobiaceae bacterium]|nr:zinc ribbon domain-containing protein [Atopobiaceae bacterium]